MSYDIIIHTKVCSKVWLLSIRVEFIKFQTHRYASSYFMWIDKTYERESIEVYRFR